VTTRPPTQLAGVLRSGHPGDLPSGERLLVIFTARATVSRASRPERGRELATGSAKGSTAARPGRPARLEDVRKVLTDDN